jgi:pyrophosphatase PpaX
MQELKPKPRAVIFDLDGTLADTFELIIAAWNFAIPPHTGKTYTTDEVIARFGIPDPAMIRRELPESAWARALDDFHLHYEKAHDIVTPFEGITEMLTALQSHRMPIALVTGKGRRTAVITLNKLGWDKLFDAVITGEDIADQKPAPEGLLRVAKQLNVDPRDCIFVGDSPVDIGAGKAANMRTVAAGWHPVYADELRELKPDAWAETPADVLTLCRVSN